MIFILKPLNKVDWKVYLFEIPFMFHPFNIYITKLKFFDSLLVQVNLISTNCRIVLQHYPFKF